MSESRQRLVTLDVYYDDGKLDVQAVEHAADLRAYLDQYPYAGRSTAPLIAFVEALEGILGCCLPAQEVYRPVNLEKEAVPTT
jgi:hypothetical protein